MTPPLTQEYFFIATPDLNKIDVAPKSFTALQYGEPAADDNPKKIKDSFAPPSAKALDRIIKGAS